MFHYYAIGNLTKDAEARQFDERFAISLSIAVNRKYKDKEYATFLNLTYWSKSDKVVQYLKKGKKIAVSGDWYSNTKGKDDKYYQDFTVRELQLLSPIESNESNPKDTYSTMGVEKGGNTGSNGAQDNPFGDDEDDGLPF